MRAFALIMVMLSMIALQACQNAVEHYELFNTEQVQLEQKAGELTSWADSIVVVVSENDKDLNDALQLVEAEQQRDLSNDETEQFSSIQRSIQSRSTVISELFSQGNELQIGFFSQMYAYLGKLDSGANYCGIENADFQHLNLSGLPDSMAWPQFEKAYQQSYDSGKQFLNTNKNYPCDEFLSKYQILRDDINARLMDVNKLLESLRFS